MQSRGTANCKGVEDLHAVYDLIEELRQRLADLEAAVEGIDARLPDDED